MARVRVTSLRQLAELAKGRRSVYAPHTVWSKPKPAAFLLNLQGVCILNVLNIGLYIYERKTYGK